MQKCFSTILCLLASILLCGCAAQPMPQTKTTVNNEDGSVYATGENSGPDNYLLMTPEVYTSRQNLPTTGGDLSQGPEENPQTLSYVGPGPSTLFNWAVLKIQGSSHSNPSAEGVEFEFDAEKNSDGLKVVKVAKLSIDNSSVIGASAVLAKELVPYWIKATEEQRAAMEAQMKAIGEVGKNAVELVKIFATAGASGVVPDVNVVPTPNP